MACRASPEFGLDSVSTSFPPLCFHGSFFTVLSAHLSSLRIFPWLGWQRDLQKHQRETDVSSEQEVSGEVWGRLGSVRL